MKRLTLLLLTMGLLFGQAVISPDEVLERYAGTKHHTPSGVWVCSEEDRHYSEAIASLQGWIADTYEATRAVKRNCGRSQACVKAANKAYQDELEDVRKTKRLIEREHGWRVGYCLEMRAEPGNR